MEYLTELLNAILLLCNFALIPGITYGSQLALGALGVTVVFGILNFSNFAIGEMMAFGTVATIIITGILKALGITFGLLPTALLALPFAILVSIFLALFFDKFCYSYHRKNDSKPIIFLIVSIGIMFVINGLNRFILGTGDVQFTDGAKFIIKAREFKQLTGLDEGISLRTTQLITVLVSVAVVLGLFYFLYQTRMGKAMRAYSDNKNLALLSGINPQKIVLYTWIIVASLTSISGVLYGLDKSYQSFTYFQLLLPIFAAAILGGLGNPLGAIVGGYVIALSEVMVTYAFKKFFNYVYPFDWQPEGLLQLVATEYKFAVSFFILVAVLLIRPTGIFKGKVV